MERAGDCEHAGGEKMKGAITGLVAVHLIVTLWHGNSHQSLAIVLPAQKNAFVYLVIVLAPIIATMLIWTRFVIPGTWVFFGSMLGSFVFGVYHHYVLVSPDHIHHLPSGDGNARWAFVMSAGTLAALELAGAMYGAFCLRELRASRAQTKGT